MKKYTVFLFSLISLFLLDYEISYSQSVNLAFNKPVTVDSEFNGSLVAENAVDGDTIDGASRWASANSADPHWIEVDLLSSYDIEKIEFWSGQSGSYNMPIPNYTLQYWDRGAWVNIVDSVGNTSSVIKHDVSGVNTDKIRLYIDVGATFLVRLYEISVWGPTIPVTGISLDKDSLDLPINTTAQLTETFEPANAANRLATWTSSDSAVAIVDGEGLVTALSEGEAYIKITTDDGGFTDSCYVNVSFVEGFTRTVIIEGSKDDVLLYSDSTIANSGGTTQRVGGSTTGKDGAAIHPFLLPLLDSREKIVSAQFSIGLEKVSNSPQGSVDLYAIPPRVTSDSNLISDFYQGDFGGDTVGTGIQDDFATKASFGVVTSSASGDTNLATFINDQYSMGNPAGKYLYLRLNPDAPDVTNFHYWSFYSADDAVSENRPSLVLTIMSEVYVSGVTLSDSAINIVPTETVNLIAVIAPDSATDKSVTWSSDNSSVATVDASGLVTGVTTGTTMIKVTTNDGGFIDSCEVMVTATIPVTKVSLSDSAITITPTETVNLTATVTPYNATNDTVTWTSDNEAVATVDDNGIVTGVAGGTTIIKATTNDGGFTDSCEVIVTSTIPVTGISLSDTAIEVAPTKTVTLIATLTPANATNDTIIWTSSDTDVATVDSNGLITPVTDEGITIIKVTTKDGGFVDSCVVTVKPAGNKYYCDPISGSMANDGSKGSPWSTLEDVFDANKTFGEGDYIYLKTGNHGAVTVKGINTDYVTITADSAETPEVDFMIFSSASKWIVSDLEFSPTFDPTSGVSFFVRMDVNSTYNTIKNCEMFSVFDTNSAVEWDDKAWSGFDIDGPNNTFLYNNLKNVRWGFRIDYTAVYTRGDYNTITNLMNDGIQSLANYCIYQYNTIKNAYEIDDNHDDFFQCYSYDGSNIGTTTVYGCVVRGNTFISFTDPNQFDKSDIQGVGNFDGFFEDWIVENNVIITDMWHGITFLGARNCKIVNNTVVENPIDGYAYTPWIMVKYHKNKTASSGNIIKNNLASGFELDFAGTDSVISNNIQTKDYAAHFVDHANFDVHLKSTSSAINAGIASDAASIDRDGVARPQAGTYDVGAYEYTGAVVQVTGVSVMPTALDLLTSQSSNLTLDVQPFNATNQNVTWSSSNSSVAAVDNGTVTGLSSGTATITVTTLDGAFTANCTVTVTKLVTGVSLSNKTIDIAMGKTANLTATVSPANATDVTVSWNSTNTAIATVDAVGLVTGVAEGTAIIVVTTNDGGFTDSCIVNIIVPVTGVSLSDTLLELLVGDTDTLIATIEPADASDDSVIWASNDTAIVKVDANGIITALAEGTTTIVVTTNDGDFTDTCEVVVNKKPSSINKLINNIGLEIYPNPSNTGEIFVRISDYNPNTVLKIVDVTGKLVYIENLTKSITQINTSTLEKGIYFVVLTKGTYVNQSKLIIQ